MGKKSVNFSIGSSPSPSRYCTASWAVVGPRHSPDPSCPAATIMLGRLPGMGPISGRPPRANGRSPTLTSDPKGPAAAGTDSASAGRKCPARVMIASMIEEEGSEAHPLNSRELPTCYDK